MEPEVFTISGSPFVWRVLLTLELKRASYTNHVFEMSKGEHKAADYLALNPRGKVPTLRDGAVVVAESLAIMAYLDRKIPEPPLFGQTAEETGRIWKAVLDSALYLDPAALRVVLPIFRDLVGDNAEDMKAAAQEVHAELARMEETLAGGDWLEGDAITAADIAAYPVIEVLQRAAGKESAQPLALGFLPLDETYPAIEAWRRRITELPGYERTYPPNWREAA